MNKLNYEEEKVIEIAENAMNQPSYLSCNSFGKIRRVLREKEITDQGNKQIESMNKMLRSIEDVLSR